MARKRVHLLSAVNAGAVSKAGGTFTIRDVCGAVDDIVMNGMLYPADQLVIAAPGLTGKPAPAGHPKNGAGQFISANSGEALLSSYQGAVCTNGRHEGGRTLVDIVVNEAQAKANGSGARLVERLDAAIAGTNTEPIHVSTGLVCEAVNAGGESNGKKYSRIATNIAYDHLAILLDEKGAGTPEDGVGMFLNSAGQEEEIERAELDLQPDDRRSAGLLAWVKRLVVGNGSGDISFDAITSGMYALMPEGCWIREVFDRYAVWTDRDGRMWKQDYSVSSEGSVAFSGQAVEVTRKVEYHPITNHERSDQMKNLLVAALNAAGIKTDGLTDEQVLAAYNALTVKPVQDKLDAANSKVEAHAAAARAAEETEVATLATELAVNSTLTVDDLKKLGKARLVELKAKAAPVVTGNGGGKGDDAYAGYSLNSFIDAKQA